MEIKVEEGCVRKCLRERKKVETFPFFPFSLSGVETLRANTHVYAHWKLIKYSYYTDF